MKIAQFHDKERIRLGIIEMIDFIKTKPECKPSGKAIALANITLAPPVSSPSKIVAIGLNYSDHIRESKGDVPKFPLIFAKFPNPKFPLIFAKFPNSLIGHKDLITWDVNLTKKVDFEAELAVIIGKRVHKCSETEAMEAIFGYTCANDVSARDLQFGDGQWVRGKSLDTFCPLGPWITTADDAHGLLPPMIFLILIRLGYGAGLMVRSCRIAQQA